MNYKELLLNIDNYPIIRKLRYDLIKLCKKDEMKMNTRNAVKYEINYNNNEVQALYDAINKWIEERHYKRFLRHENEDHYYRELYYLTINEINKWIYYTIEKNTYGNLLEVLKSTESFYLSVIVNTISKYVVNIKINISEIINILYKVRNEWINIFEDVGYGSCNIYDDFYKNYNDLADAFYNNKYIIVLTSSSKYHLYIIADNRDLNEITNRINNSDRIDKLRKYSLLVCENNFENMFVNPDILCSGLKIKESNYYVKFNNYDSKTKIYTVDVYA